MSVTVTNSENSSKFVRTLYIGICRIKLCIWFPNGGCRLRNWENSKIYNRYSL